MVHPIYVTEQAVRNFIAQWFSGLKPTLRLTTKEDGSITVMSQISSPSVMVQTFNPNRRRRQRSGISSRHRRRNNREVQENPTSRKHTDIVISDCHDPLSLTHNEAVSEPNF